MAGSAELAERRKHIWATFRTGRFNLMDPSEETLSINASWGPGENQKAWFTLDPKRYEFLPDYPVGDQLKELGEAFLAGVWISSNAPAVRRMIEWLEGGDECDDDDNYVPPNVEVMSWACANRGIRKLSAEVNAKAERLRMLRRLATQNPWDY